MIKFNAKNRPQFEFKKAVKKPIVIECYQIQEPFEVETLEGKLKGKKGDWLMVGIQGELYPCNQEIFAKSYDII